MTLLFGVVFSLSSSAGRIHAQEINRDANSDDQTVEDSELTRQIEKSVVAAIAHAEKSVVAIARVRKGQIADPKDPRFVPQEFGSGVVIKADGLILTNYHVLGDPEQFDYFVWVQREAYQAVEVLKAEQVIAADPWTDLAVLRIRAVDLKPIRFGDGGDLTKGEFVIALGNPYAIARDGEPSASWGIVSNLTRQSRAHALGDGEDDGSDTIHELGTLIQTDARLEYGSSGGALINLQGQMVGLTSSLAAIDRFDTPAGFAIPTDSLFRRTVDSLLKSERIEYGFLGVSPRELTSEKKAQGKRGVGVAQVVEGTPAYLAGIRFGDTITHINGTAVRDSIEFSRELGKQLSGSTVLVSIVRDRVGVEESQNLKFNVKLSKRYLNSNLPPLPSRAGGVWRGMEVDSFTAIPRFAERSRFVDPDGCVAVTTVERNSAAWDSGMRPREFVSKVNGTRVTSPDDFYRLIESAGDKPVSLTVSSSDRQSPDVRVVEFR